MTELGDRHAHGAQPLLAPSAMAWLAHVLSCDLRAAPVRRLVGRMSSDVVRVDPPGGEPVVVRVHRDRAWLEREPDLVAREVRALTLLERAAVIPTPTSVTAAGTWRYSSGSALPTTSSRTTVRRAGPARTTRGGIWPPPSGSVRRRSPDGGRSEITLERVRAATDRFVAAAMQQVQSSSSDTV